MNAPVRQSPQLRTVTSLKLNIERPWRVMAADRHARRWCAWWRGGGDAICSRRIYGFGRCSCSLNAPTSRHRLMPRRRVSQARLVRRGNEAQCAMLDTCGNFVRESSPVSPILVNGISFSRS